MIDREPPALQPPCTQLQASVLSPCSWCPQLQLGTPLPRPSPAPMRAVSEEQRWRAVFVFKATGDIGRAAKEAGISRGAARTWVARWAATGGVAEKPKSGRRRALTGEAAKEALSLLVSSNMSGATGAAAALHTQGITPKQLHKTTVIRAAKGAAKSKGVRLWVHRGRPVRALTQPTMQKRLAFALANKKRDWARVLFTDRKKFLFHYPGQKVNAQGWCMGGQKREAHSPNRPDALNVYAGISRQGVTDVHVVAGTSKQQGPYCNKQGKPARNITSEEYRVVLESTLLPGGQRVMGGRGLTCWTLQQDNDPTHRVASAVVQSFNKRRAAAVELLPNWPPSSPDLNPIENVWAYVQRRVNAQGCATFTDFTAAVKQELRAIPKAMLTKLIDSMTKRLAEVVRKKGGKTKY